MTEESYNPQSDRIRFDCPSMHSTSPDAEDDEQHSNTVARSDRQYRTQALFSPPEPMLIDEEPESGRPRSCTPNLSPPQEIATTSSSSTIPANGVHHLAQPLSTSHEPMDMDLETEPENIMPSAPGSMTLGESSYATKPSPSLSEPRVVSQEGKQRNSIETEVQFRGSESNNSFHTDIDRIIFAQTIRDRYIPNRPI